MTLLLLMATPMVMVPLQLRHLQLPMGSMLMAVLVESGFASQEVVVKAVVVSSSQVLGSLSQKHS